MRERIKERGERARERAGILSPTFPSTGRQAEAGQTGDVEEDYRRCLSGILRCVVYVFDWIGK